MTLLLVGIVAVILVILVAAFFTFRRGQDDDRDEPGGRSNVRDLVRWPGRDGRWRNPSQESRAPGRLGRAEPPGRKDERARGYDDAPPEYADHRGGRGHREQHADRGYPGRQAGRYADSPDVTDYPAQRTRGTRQATPAARRPGARRQPDGYDTGGYDTGPGEQLYDTGPSPVMGNDMPNEHEFPPDHEDDSALTDSDVFPRIRTDVPLKAQVPAKSRSRQSRSSKRGDDDDWPSTEWDKLSDEQYWAELSADKPLATTARTAQPSAAKATPAPPSPPPAKPAPAKPVQGRQSAAKPPRPTSPAPKPSPDRESVAPRRRDSHREAPTEALPVRNRPRPAAAPAAAAPQSRETGEPSLAMLTSLAKTPNARRSEPVTAARDDDPLTSPSFSRQTKPTQDSRSYQSAGRNRQRGSTADYPTGGSAGEYPTGDYPTGDYSTGDYPAGGYQSRGYQSGGYPSGGYPSPGYGNGANGNDNGNSPNSNGPQRYQPDDGEHTNPQAAYPAAWPGEHRAAPQPAPQPPLSAAPQPQLPPAPQRAPAGNPYGSYVDNAPAAVTGSHARYPENQGRLDAGYGGYTPAAAGTGYPEPPLGQQPAGSAPVGGFPGQANGWHPAPPPAATPEFPTDPASQYLYTGGSGYPDTAGYAAAPPADPSYPGGYAEPASYPEDTYNGTGYTDRYSTDPYGPDGYGDYRPRQA